jgi:hypothetical protein
LLTSTPHSLCARRALAPQFDRGLGASEGDVIEKYYFDPKLAKGKRPGEGDMGKLLCAALFERKITPVLTTWTTIGLRIDFLISEALKWEAAYGGLDKMPTGRAKCTRSVHNSETNELEERDWPWEDWMWPMIRLGRQRNGQEAAEKVKKEEQTTNAAAQLAEQAVAKLQAQVLAATTEEERAELKAKLHNARERLVLVSGGRRGVVKGKKKRKRVKMEGECDGPGSGSDEDDSDEEEESDSAGGEGAEPPRKGRSSGVDGGIAELLKNAQATTAATQAAMERMSAEAARQREHEKDEAAKGREHALELARLQATSNKELVVGLAAAMAQFAKQQ